MFDKIKASAPALVILLLASCASTPNPMAREWYDLGVAWQEKGDWKKAGEAYSRALALDPTLAAASYNLARALTESGDYAGALRVLDELAKQDPGNVRVLSARAYALHKKGDNTAALEAYRELLALDPYAPDAVFNAALLELAAGNPGAAAEALERLTKAKTEDGEAFALLGKALDKLGLDEKEPSNSERALAAYERALELGKADAAVLSRIGQLRESRKEYSEAMDAYAAAVKAAPKMAETWFALARLRLVVAGDGENGLEALKSAVASGFSDAEKAVSLIDEPTLVEREKVQELLADAGLVK
jgi:tetratricopeptide (TPR) repeat protein